MKRSFPFAQACFVVTASLFLAVILMLSTKNYQRSTAPGCYGHLGAGFPMAFICDDPGGAPLSSAGKIDQADVINPFGFLVDILFYTVFALIAFGIAYLIFTYTRKITSRLR